MVKHERWHETAKITETSQSTKSNEGPGGRWGPGPEVDVKQGASKMVLHKIAVVELHKEN